MSDIHVNRLKRVGGTSTASKPMKSQRSRVCLMPPTPCQWEGLFTALKGNRSLQQAELWIKEDLITRYADHVPAQWQVLLEFLSDQVVSGSCEKLVFSTVLSNLPPDLQRNILAVIYQHRGDINMDILTQFVQQVKTTHNTITWTTLLWRLLAEHVGLTHKVNPTMTLPGQEASTEDPNATSPAERADKMKELPDRMVAETAGAPGAPADEGRQKHGLEGREEEKPDVGGTDIGPDFIIILDEDEDGCAPPTVKKIKSEDSEEERNPTMISDRESCALDQELMDNGIRLREMLLGSADDRVSIEGELQTLLRTPPNQLATLCQVSELTNLPDPILAVVGSVLVKMSDSVTYRSCVALLAGLVTNKVRSLAQSAARMLQDTLISLAETFPLQLLDAIVAPSVVQELGAAQSEILCRLCKDSLLPSHHAYLLRKFVQQTVTLTEPGLTLLHVAMDAKPDLDEEDSTAILDCLSRSADQFHSNLKFGKLLLSFVNKYAKQWTPLQVAMMGHICGHNKTFLKKTISSILKRLTR
ncbi:uncharacterized protein LOC124112250 isoform X2 [Haliotis rufescens]|uniref:uncharacterized protein LOC124112250 isoform X2 n=1 Tax=Haliotis rufescens TaxID=6454 RepID=UPI001EB0A08D|nr:uncharacterized protein LOC124112250 isoform X2 [Haliotis rufescens]